MRWLLRIFLALSGGAVAALFIALVETSAVLRGMKDATPPPGFFGTLLHELGLLGPVALFVGVGIGVGAIVVDPEGTPVLKRIAYVRAARVRRMRAAAVVPLLVFVVFATTVGAAHVSKSVVGLGAPPESGLSMGLGTIAFVVVTLLAALSILPSFWRLLVKVFADSRLADPLVTGGAALLLVLVFAIIGMLTGGPNGDKGFPVVNVFGVLMRPELDLRPVISLALLAFIGFMAGTLASYPWARNAALGGSVLALFLLVLCTRSSATLEAELASGIQRNAPLGGIALGALRKATDRDGDGHSPKFGGADCDDTNKNINPTQADIPGNGIDEDCSGGDTPLPPPEEKKPVQASAKKEHKAFNVIFITVDTLVSSLGFNGYPRPITPNLDKLAAKSTVFDHAYSLSSYTAKSVGPMHIGRYPSECMRDYQHYTNYNFPKNTFMAKRMQAAGVRTIGGHCHYYFMWKTGYSNGFDVYDGSAIAPGMGDGDGSTTSDRLSDLALKLLAPAENTAPPPMPDGKRRPFFAWFHYFDPHAQYVKHPSANPPDFKSMEGPTKGRDVYDEEVWFTDKHLGRVFDFVASQPWGKDTAFVITADHGEAFGDHGVATHGHELYDPLVRVPLVVYVPGQDPKRISIKRSAIDVAPTILDLLGVPEPPAGELRGTSLLYDVYADKETPLAERDIYLDMPEGPMNDMRRAHISGPSPGMKLLHFGGKRYELYDLKQDPGERQNLATNEELLKSAIDRMQGFRARMSEINVTGGR